VGDVDGKAATASQGLDHGGRLIGRDLPGRPAFDAMEMAVDRGGQDVELLAAVGAVAVAEQSQLFEDIERAVDGRRDRRRIDLPATFDELGPRDVAVRPRQHLDEGPPLRGPTQAARPEMLANVRPVHRASRGV
jgi:hypothetical protein